VIVHFFLSAPCCSRTIVSPWRSISIRSMGASSSFGGWGAFVGPSSAGAAGVASAVAAAAGSAFFHPATSSWGSSEPRGTVLVTRTTTSSTTNASSAKMVDRFMGS